MTGQPLVFLGPSLTRERALQELDAEYLSPVQLGDVWRVSQEQPPAIGIVDGYFDRVPAVRHKEILFALSRGIPVYGSASMGALRSAELAAFGMVPVGAIAAAFLAGELACDDEVALMHSDGVTGYCAFSEPLVNIRATIAAALAAGVVSRQSALTIVQHAQLLNYRDRAWDFILERAPADAADIQALKRWLPAGRVDQKKKDAIAMLQRMRADLADADRPPSAPMVFTPTVLWQEFVRQETPIAAILEEFFLTDPLSTALRTAVAGAQRKKPVDWLGVLEAEADWPERCRRARRKQACRPTVPSDQGEVDGLLSWFFGERLGWPADLPTFLRDRGWTDPDCVLAVAAREAAFVKSPS
jgi:hypothetical protein